MTESSTLNKVDFDNNDYLNQMDENHVDGQNILKNNIGNSNGCVQETSVNLNEHEIDLKRRSSDPKEQENDSLYDENHDIDNHIVRQSEATPILVRSNDTHSEDQSNDTYSEDQDNDIHIVDQSKDTHSEDKSNDTHSKDQSNDTHCEDQNNDTRFVDQSNDADMKSQSINTHIEELKSSSSFKEDNHGTKLEQINNDTYLGDTNGRTHFEGLQSKDLSITNCHDLQIDRVDHDIDHDDQKIALIDHNINLCGIPRNETNIHHSAENRDNDVRGKPGDCCRQYDSRSVSRSCQTNEMSFKARLGNVGNLEKSVTSFSAAVEKVRSDLASQMNADRRVLLSRLEDEKIINITNKNQEIERKVVDNMGMLTEGRIEELDTVHIAVKCEINTVFSRFGIKELTDLVTKTNEEILKDTVERTRELRSELDESHKTEMEVLESNYKERIRVLENKLAEQELQVNELTRRHSHEDRSAQRELLERKSAQRELQENKSAQRELLMDESKAKLLRSSPLADGTTSKSGSKLEEELARQKAEETSRSIQKYCEDLHAQLAVKCSELKKSKEEIGAKDVRISELQQQVNSLESNLNDMKEKLRIEISTRQNRDKHVESLNAKITSRDLENGHLKAKLGEVMANLDKKLQDQKSAQESENERKSLKKTNDKLLNLLSDFVRLTSNLEDRIARHSSWLSSHACSQIYQSPPVSSPLLDRDSWPSHGSVYKNNSSLSASLKSSADCRDSADEGLDLTSRSMDCIFAGTELDIEIEDITIDANNRLSKAVERLIETLGTTTRQLSKSEHDVCQLNDKIAENEECFKQLEGECERLKESLKNATQMNLDTMQSADIIRLENDQLRVSIAELQSAVEASKKQIENHSDQTRVIEQLKGLLETRDTESQVRREQLVVLEKTIEQLKKERAEAVESHRAELEDHKCRADALEKQVKSEKKFLEGQLAEREQERLEFEQECKRLQAFHQDHERQEIAKQRLFREELEKLAADQTDRLNQMEEQDEDQRQQILQLQKQAENLRNQLEREKDAYEQLLLEKSNLEKTLSELQKSDQELANRLKHLKQEIEAKEALIADLQQKLNAIEEELLKQRRTNEELSQELKNRVATEARSKDLQSIIKELQEALKLEETKKQQTSKKFKQELEQVQTKLHAEESASKEKIVRLEEKVAAVENDNWQQVAVIKDLKKQLEETVAAKAAVKRANEDIEQELNRLKLDLKDLRDVRRSFEEALEDKENLQVQVQDQLKQISSLRSQVDEMKLVTNKSLDDAKELTRLRQILDDERQFMDAKDKKITDLNRQISEQLEHNSQLSAQIEALSEAVNDEKSEVQALNNVLREKENLMEFLTSKVQSLQNEIRTLTDSHTQLKHHYERETKRLENEITEKQNIIDIGVEELMLLQTEASNRDHEISVHQRQLEQTNGELEARNLEIKKLHEEIENLKKKMVEGEDELKAISGRLQMTRENENVLSESLEKKEDQIAKMNLRLFESEDVFKRKQAELEEKIEEQASLVIEPLRLAVKQKEHNIWQLQQAMDKLHEKQANDLAEMEKRHVDYVAAMQKNLADEKEVELREISMEHAERLAGLKNTFDDESEKIRAELEGERKREVLALRERAECDRKLQEERHVKELEEVIRRHEVEMKKVTRRHAEELEVVAEKFRSELEDKLQRQQELHAEEMSKFEEHYGQCLEKAEQSHNTELEKTKEVLVTERDAELADLEEKHRFELHQLKSELEGEFEEYVNETLLKEWQRKTQDEIDRLAEDQQKEIENLEKCEKSKHADHISRLQSAWQKEKDCLSREIEANRQLIQDFGIYSQTVMKGEDVDDVDWRGVIFRSVHGLITSQTAATMAERCSNAVLFKNAQDSVDLLEKSISEQDQRHKHGLEQILNIDRQSMLAEIAELNGQIRILQQEVLDDNQQMTQKLTDIETQFDRKEKRLKRQLNATETRLAEEKRAKEQILSDLEREKAKTSDLVDQLTELQSTLSEEKLRLTELSSTLMEEKTRNAELLQKKADEESETREYINKLELKQRDAEEYKAQATSQVQALESRLAEMEEREHKTEEELEEVRQINAELAEQVDALSSDLENIRLEHDSEMSQLEEQLEKYSNLEKQLQESNENLAKERSFREELLQKHETSVEELQSKLNEECGRSVELKTQLRREQSKLIDVRNRLEDNEDSVGRQLHQERLQQKQLQSSISRLEDGKEKLTAELKRSREKICVLERDQERLASDLDLANKKLNMAASVNKKQELSRLDDAKHVMDKKRLISIWNRLLLLAVRLQEELARQMNTSSKKICKDSSQEFQSMAGSAGELLAELNQCNVIFNCLQDEDQLLTKLVPDLNQETMRHNNELTQYISRLNKDKQDLQSTVNKLEALVARLQNGKTMIPTEDLYKRCLRAENFQKALIYQKRYLLLLLGGFQDGEQQTLAAIAQMGAFPSDTDFHRQSHFPRPRNRFRIAAMVICVIYRLGHKNTFFQQKPLSSPSSSLVPDRTKYHPGFSSGLLSTSYTSQFQQTSPPPPKTNVFHSFRLPKFSPISIEPYENYINRDSRQSRTSSRFGDEYAETESERIRRLMARPRSADFTKDRHFRLLPESTSVW